MFHAYAELMCGPNLDIPCSLYGCGDANEEGIYGQYPCSNYYPRDCLFTFKSGLANYEENVITLDIPTFTLPAISDFNDAAVTLNDYIEEPIVYIPTGEEIVGCTVTEIYYTKCIKDMDYYNVNCTQETEYPYLNDTSADDEMVDFISLEGLFAIYGDGGGKEISVNPISNLNAVSLYSALRNTSTVLTLECSVASSVAAIESCLLFEIVPTNESPDLISQDASILNPAYRFYDPPVPALTFQEVIEGEQDEYLDMVMNEDNPIVTLYGELPPFCNGTVFEYQGEEGSWYSIFLGTEGYYYDTDHILYVDENYMYSSIIQAVWSGLEDTVAGRNLRMEVECLTSDGYSLGVGYLYFGTTYADWNGEEITCTGDDASDVFCEES